MARVDYVREMTAEKSCNDMANTDRLSVCFRKCHILNPENPGPNRDSNPTVALVTGKESRRAKHYTTRLPCK